METGNRNNLKTNRKVTIKNLENKNGKENKCTDTSSDNCTQDWPGHDNKKNTWS